MDIMNKISVGGATGHSKDMHFRVPTPIKSHFYKMVVKFISFKTSLFLL